MSSKFKNCFSLCFTDSAFGRNNFHLLIKKAEKLIVVYFYLFLEVQTNNNISIFFFKNLKKNSTFGPHKSKNIWARELLILEADIYIYSRRMRILFLEFRNHSFLTLLWFYLQNFLKISLSFHSHSHFLFSYF